MLKSLKKQKPPDFSVRGLVEHWKT